MKETVDGKTIDGQDGSAILPTSTKTLVGGHVHGVRPPGWYYTHSEWSRLGMQGPLPPERIKGGDEDRLTDENLQEDSNTKHKSQ